MSNQLPNKINVSLLENVLMSEKDNYMAKVQLVGTMTNEHIAQEIVRERSEFRYETILNILNLGSEVKRTRLANGHAINDGVLQIYPSVSGNFVGSAAKFDSHVHSLGITAVANVALRKAMMNTSVIVQGVASTGPAVNKVEDMFSRTINEMLTPGRNLKVFGQKLRISGENPENGIWFIDANDPDKRVKVDERDVVDNNPSQLTIIVPTLDAGSYYLEVVTQYSTSGSIVKAPRSYRFEIQLSVI